MLGVGAAKDRIVLDGFARGLCWHGRAIGFGVLRSLADGFANFSSSRVHETFSVRGRARVTLATFASWNSFEEGGEVQLWQ